MSHAINKIIPFPWTIAKALGLDLYSNQVEILKECVKPFSRVALQACNGFGKTTAIAAPLVLWHAIVFKNSLTVLTSGAWRQVKEQLFPAIRRFQQSFPDWTFNTEDFTAINGSRCIGFSTNDPGKFEGHHALDHEKSPLLMIIDEAKSVQDEINEAKERCQPTRELLMSSPGKPSGFFYEACKGKQAHRYKHFHVRAHDCPHISKEWIKEQAETYGTDSAFYRSMVEGEFTSDPNELGVIRVEHLERCLKTPSEWTNRNERRVFIDISWAANGDENVLALRRGNKITIEDTWVGDGNTINTAHRFIKNLNRLKSEIGLSSSEVFGDNGGGGHGVIDVIREMGWNINRINNNSTSKESDKFANISAEWWFVLAKKIERNEIIIPDDAILKQQLLSRKYEVDLKGRLRLESKEKLDKSPDRADAVVGAAQYNFVDPVFYNSWSAIDQFRDLTSNKEDVLQGANTGW